MPTLIAIVVKWIVQKLALLLLILAVLLVGSWLRSEWRLRILNNEIERQQSLVGSLRAELDERDSAIAADTVQWRRQAAIAAQAFTAKLDALNARIASAEPKWQAALDKFSNLERMTDTSATAAARARAEFVALEQDFWFWDRLLSPGKLAALEAARVRHAALEKNARAWKAARDGVAPKFAKSPVAPLYERRAPCSRASSMTARRPVSPRHARFTADRERKQQQVRAAEAQLAAQQERAAEDPRSVLFQTIQENLPLALGVLAGILLMPLVIRAVFLFRAGPRSPAGCRRSGSCRTTACPRLRPRHLFGVSVAIGIHPGEELLVQPSFLQSSSQPARKRTQWFLNLRLPVPPASPRACSH